MDPARLIPGSTRSLPWLALPIALAFTQTPSIDAPQDVAHREPVSAIVADWPDPVRSDVTKLPLDALIALLPPRDRQQRTLADGRVEKHPVAREFAARLLRGDEPWPAQWTSLLLRTRALQFRHRWPLTAPLFAGSMFIGIDLPQEYGCVTVLARTPNAWKVRRGWNRGEQPILGCGMEYRDWPRDVDPILNCVGALAHAGSHTIEFDVTVESVQTKFSVGFEFVPTLDDAMPPASGPTIDAAVRDSIGLRLRGNDEWKRPVFTFERSSARHPEIASVAICADLEWLRDGETLSACHLDSREGTCELRHVDGSASPPSECSDFAAHAAEFASPSPVSGRAPTLRITSRDWHVLTQWSCDRYWRGSCDLPLELLLRQAERH